VFTVGIYLALILL